MIGVDDDRSSDAADPVGRVLGTADATPLQFWTAVTPGSYLQLDDVVETRRDLPDREPVTIAGVVTQVRARHEGAQFDSDVFAIAEGMLPALVQEAAEITTTRVDPELYVPPAPGAVVRRASGSARDAALHFDRMERRVPMGTGRDGVPVFLNADFLDGTRGAHVSISGISGVATKTSFATFLLYSVFRAGALGASGVNARALIFNVKGEDLLFLDHPNTRLDEPTTAAYKLLELPATAFPDVRVYAPPRAGDGSGAPDVTSRLTGVDSFYWTLEEFCAGRLLPYVFADADDERQQYTMVVHSVTAHLARHAVPADGGISIDGVRIGSYGDLVDHVVDQLTDDETRSTWAGSAINMGTVNAFARRLISSKRDLARLIRGDLAARRPHKIKTAESAQVTVVDLHNLPDRAQRFVVGVTLKTEFEEKEKAGTGKPLLFVVLDELNKYAPREGTSPIKEVLRDPRRRPPRPGGGVPPRVRVPAAGDAAARAAGPPRHDVRQPAGHPGAAVRGVPVPGVGDAAFRGRSDAVRHDAVHRAGRRPVRGRRRARRFVRRRHPVLGFLRCASCTRPTGTSGRSSRAGPATRSTSACWPRSSRSPAPSGPTW